MNKMLALPRVFSTTSRAFSTTSRASIAKMTVVGRLAASPELVPTSTGHEVTRYSLASNSGRNDKRITSWYTIAAFLEDGPQRDYLLALEKGSLLYVECAATMSHYEDKETGKKIPSLNLRQRSMEVLSRPNRAGEAGEGEQQ